MARQCVPLEYGDSMDLYLAGKRSEALDGVASQNVFPVYGANACFLGGWSSESLRAALWLAVLHL